MSTLLHTIQGHMAMTNQERGTATCKKGIVIMQKNKKDHM
jgi:hypothetical protein